MLEVPQGWRCPREGERGARQPAKCRGTHYSPVSLSFPLCFNLLTVLTGKCFIPFREDSAGKEIVALRGWTLKRNYTGKYLFLESEMWNEGDERETRAGE